MENLKINPYLEEMEKARQSISYFILISGRYNLENDNESIKKCSKGLKEIMNTLEKNCLSYPRVSTLFKVNLPEMSSLLLQYTSLVEANCVKESDTKLLNETFINFLLFHRRLYSISIMMFLIYGTFCIHNLYLHNFYTSLPHIFLY